MKGNNNIYTILLVFALASLALIVFLIWPTFLDIEKNSQDLVSAKNSIADLAAQIVEVEKFEKNYAGYKPNLDKMDQLFIDPNNPVDFIKFLENAAASSQITSKISLPSSSATAPNYVIFQFSTSGQFSRVMDFARQIEAGPYLLEIESLTMQNSQNISRSGPVAPSSYKDYSMRPVDATFTIKVFSKK